MTLNYFITCQSIGGTKDTTRFRTEGYGISFFETVLSTLSFAYFDTNIDSLKQYCIDYTPEQKRKYDLINSCNAIDCFTHEGRIYAGSIIYAVESFIKNNPNPADFSVWLQKNLIEL